MASAYPSSALPGRGAAYRSPAPNAPPGTFLPGTKVQVGSHRVVIEKYLSEGGFAHVYVVRVPQDGNKHEIAVLKRVAVPDKDHLANMRTEVETMKKLKGHTKIVSYMDSHASQLKGGGYEVFLLMEFCSGGGLIDFMNTRLQHRLTEPEILKIFGDVAEGVACMHYLKPPLLHRDLKVENVLISKSASGTPTYKLCDFGSTAPPRPAAKTAEEGRLIEEDVQKHTTMQYRSPEMIDVWRKQPIDEKADIWALGVLLYKLCYYTTPFEEVGQMAILNASFKYPHYPQFSDRLKKFIGSMLREDPRQRPNIYQVVKEACTMRGVHVPIKDIYADRTQSEDRRNQTLPPREPAVSSPGPSIGLQRAMPQREVHSIPDVTPMRRGRVPQSAQQAPNAAKANPSPARGDPFAALDSKNFEVRAGAVDELSKRFPSLDEFSIAQDKSGQFPFAQSPPISSPPVQNSLNERMTNALADDLFKVSNEKADVPRSSSTTQLQQQNKPIASPTKPKIADRVREFSQQSPLVHQPTPVRPGVKYASTGVGSSPPPTKPQKPKPSEPEFKMPEVSKRPIWRVPSHSRSTSQPRASDAAEAAAASLQPSLPPTKRPALLDMHRSKSQTATATAAAARSPTSSRPSLEGHRPSLLDIGDASISRTKSAQGRSRPSSAFVSSNLEYLRDQEAARKSSAEPRRSLDQRRSQQASPRLVPVGSTEDAPEEANIDNDLDYLRSNEEAEKRRSSSNHKKRTSLPSISGAKNIFAGRFGDAFKRFEHTDGGNAADDRPHTPETREYTQEAQMLSPILGSDATPSRHSEMSALDETEDLPPDVRRELERRRLSQEERRVADAAAEYRTRVATNGTGTSIGGAKPTRASTIQKRVQSLLDEGRQQPAPRKTAEGYGKYTEVSSPPLEQQTPQQRDQDSYALPPRGSSLPKQSVSAPTQAPSHQRVPEATQPSLSYSRTRPHQHEPVPVQHSAPAQPQQQQRVVSRPSAPPKPKVLRTAQWPPSQSSSNTAQPIQAKPTGLAALLAKDLEGVPDYPPPQSSGGNSNGANDSGAYYASNDDDVEDFSKRYPSLGGLEMVEREIGDSRKVGSVREV